MPPGAPGAGKITAVIRHTPILIKMPPRAPGVIYAKITCTQVNISGCPKKCTQIRQIKKGIIISDYPSYILHSVVLVSIAYNTTISFRRSALLLCHTYDNKTYCRTIDSFFLNSLIPLVDLECV